MTGSWKRFSTCLLTTFMCFGAWTPAYIAVQAEESTSTAQEYEIYPAPHVVQYGTGDYLMQPDVNVVYEDGIDAYTKDRLNEVLGLKEIHPSVTSAVAEGKTNILVGIDGSNGVVDQYADQHVTTAEDLFTKNDAYVLDSQDNTITVLGKDTDAAFYGLTSLYHIFTQIDGMGIRNFHIEDWADVVSRGFIEGYYGDPWSTENRADLMTWGGYYKLNSYFYAPKDDPKHNRQWRVLYTEDEINTKIKPLAEAGNRSKCRFVFALHPFMNNPITSNNYDQGLKDLQAKFKQVIDAGVRQIAILADDAHNQGAQLYQRLLTDMTAWLKEQQKTYPDLKTTLPFCPVEYMSNGQGYYKNFPENVQVVMTGGKVWGEVTNNFTNAFTANTGRGPYMWINWPCSDNSKNHLIMGGYSTFLHPGVDPAKIQGIVLNPMQESEPSKVGIFGNADYSWNIWDNEEQANQAWYDSFKYVDHNSSMETVGSSALRELSKHMINQNMDGRVTALQESVELAPKLNAFKAKLDNNTVTAEDVDTLIAEFAVLQQAAVDYRASAGDTKVRDQIVYWLDCWDDTTEAAIAYLNGVKAVLHQDTASLLTYNSEGKVAFERSRTHSFHYVDHMENAEVGVQHIVPFIRSLASYVSSHAEVALDPNKVITTFVTSRTDNPSNGIDKITDGKDSTAAIFKTPNTIKAGEFVGLTFNKPIKIENVRFLLGAGKDHFDEAKVQYLDGTEWKDLTLRDQNNLFTGVLNQPQEVKLAADKLPENFTASGIRLISTRANTNDAWLQVNEIAVNEKAPEAGVFTTEYSTNMKIRQSNLNAMGDGNNATEVWLSEQHADSTAANSYIQLTLSTPQLLGTIHFAQSASSGTDFINKGELQYKNDAGVWTKLADVNGNKVQDFNVSEQNITAKELRIVNKENKPVWWRVGEFTVKAKIVEKDTAEFVYTNLENTDILSNNKNGKAYLTNGTVTLNKDQYIGLDLKNILDVTNVATTELPSGLKLETSMNGVTWTAYAKDKNVDARYIRVVSDKANVSWSMDKFEVSYTYTNKKSVTSDFAKSDDRRDVRTKKNVDNVFDGKLSTFAEVTGSQEQGKHITFDLGQTIDLTSMRFYIDENNKDYLRHAKIEVSANNKDWKQVMELGKAGIANTSNESVAKSDETLTHDSQNPGYMFKEAAGLQNIKTRYIRITPLTTYSHRWVCINELQLNGGAYISPEYKRDVVSDAVEVRNMLPSYMLDGNYATTYKSSAQNSSFTYRVSAPEGVKSVRMVQLGEVSNAEVNVKYIGDNKASKLGTLNMPINEFTLDGSKKVESFTVSWKNVVPEIAEITLSDKTAGAVDKTALHALINQAAPKDTWTKKSIARYESALQAARDIEANASVTQGVVDSAVGTLRGAIDSAIVKADNIEALRALVNEKLSNEDHTYTNVSYHAYEAALNRVVKALENADDLSKTDGDELQKNVENAKAALVYSVMERDLLESAVKTFGTFNAENYTENSYAALTFAKDQALAKIASDKAGTEKIAPSQFKEMHQAYDDAVAGLVNVVELKAEIAVDVKLDMYTEETVKAYEAAIASGREQLVSGTKESVAAAVDAIREARKNLSEKDESLNALLHEINNLNKNDYTESSYDALMKAVETKDVAAIKAKKDALVSVVGLKNAMETANGASSDLYTTSSYQVLKDALADAKALLKNGSREEISAMIDRLDTAMKGLELRVQEDTRKDIVLKKSDGYTKESYAAYKKAYDALMNADIKDLSLEEYNTLMQTFKDAEDALKLAITEPVDRPNTQHNSNDVQTGVYANPLVWVGVLGAAAVIGIIIVVMNRKKK